MLAWALPRELVSRSGSGWALDSELELVLELAWELELEWVSDSESA